MERLKILFFIPAEADSVAINHELVSQLALELRNEADVELMTHLHGTPLSVVKDYHLVHVFGCWNHGAAHLLLRARREHIPTVYTPLGGLQPWILKRHKTLQMMRLQRHMTEAALAVHVCGKLEFNTFKQLEWNNNVAIIKNPVLTSRISFAEMSQQVLALYRKVLDTYARLLLNEDSCQAIGQLLQAGVDDGVLHDKDHIQHLQELLSTLTDEDWRRIFIYASDEHIDDIIHQGLDRLHFQAVDVDVASIDRFERHTHYPEGDLPADKLLSRNLLTRNKLAENTEHEEETERHLIVELLNLKYEMDRHSAPLRHLANIYQVMRFDDMDEDRLKEIAKIMGCTSFAQRLMAVMHHVMGLTEGFMTFTPQDDHTTKSMVIEITKWNTY